MLTGTLLTDVTPSYVPLSQFGQMAAEKKSFLDKLAEIAEKAENVATVLNAPIGTSVTYTPPSPFTGGGTLNIGQKSLFSNPLFVACAAVVAVLLLRK